VGDSYQYLNPVDEYLFEAFIFVVEKATGKSVPITTFAARDAEPGDFITISNMTQTTTLRAGRSLWKSNPTAPLLTYVTVNRSELVCAWTVPERC